MTPIRGPEPGIPGGGSQLFWPPFYTDWRRITLQTSASVSDNLSVNVSGNTGGSTSQNNLIGAFTGSRTYLTKGQTVSACGRAYLVAYHLPGSTLDMSAIIQAVATKTPPTVAVLTPESSLPLSLLDLQVIGSLDDVRAFDLPSEIKESERVTRLLADLLKSQASGTSTNTASSKRPPPQIGP